MLSSGRLDLQLLLCLLRPIKLLLQLLLELLARDLEILEVGSGLVEYLL